MSGLKISSSIIVFIIAASFFAAARSCLRTRCSGTAALQQNFNKTIDSLDLTSRLLAAVTVRALNYTRFDYNLPTSCDNSYLPITPLVQAEVNITSWTNATRTQILEFHRRVSVRFSQQLKESVTRLTQVQNLTTAPNYLLSQLTILGHAKSLVTKAVNIDRKLMGMQPLPFTAGQQIPSSSMPNNTATNQLGYQTPRAVASHIMCLLEDLVGVSYQMILHFYRLPSLL